MLESQPAQAPAQVPQWEHEHAEAYAPRAEKSRMAQAIQQMTDSSAISNTKRTLRSHLDTRFPAERRYLGLRRKWLFAALIGTVLALLALIIGLAVGLTHRHRG